MIEGALVVLVVAAAVGSGLMGGAFFAFSSFVMAGLRRMPPEHGMAAMQSINVTAVTPVFMAGLFLTSAVCAAAAVWAVADWRDPASIFVLAGSGLYLGGVLVLTAAFHVPRNNALAAADPGSAEGAAVWARYLRDWTRGNHVRTITAAAAVVAFAIALRAG